MLADSALKPGALTGGIALVGVLLGLAIQVVTTRLRDRQQALLARHERLAAWRVDAYRDLLVWVRHAQTAVLVDERTAPLPVLDDQVIAQVELVGSREVREVLDAVTAGTFRVVDLHAAIKEHHGGFDAEGFTKARDLFEARGAFRMQFMDDLRRLQDACRRDLQADAAPDPA